MAGLCLFQALFVGDGKTSDTLIRLKFLGRPQIIRGGKGIPLNRKKAVALLAFLVVTGRKQNRERLADLLWRGSESDRARHALRNVLWFLNTELGKDTVVTDGDFVSLSDQAPLSIDVDVFRSKLKAVEVIESHGRSDIAPLIEAATLYRGDFLEGLSLGADAIGFEEWRFQEAEALRSEYASLLRVVVRRCSTLAEFETAIAYARRWVDLDPLDERAHRRLMELYAWTGNRRAALRQYKECQNVIANELDDEPEETTRQLYQAVKGNKVKAPVISNRMADTGAGAMIAGSSAYSATVLSAGLASDLQPSKMERPFDAASMVVIMHNRDIFEITEKYTSEITLVVGDSLISVFGVPQAGVDDAYHAVLAGIEILELGARYGFPMAIGVCKGLTYFVRADDKNAHSVSLLGPAIEKSIRLRRFANPGSIVVDKEIQDQTEGSIGFTAIECVGDSTPAYQLRVFASGPLS